MPPMEDLQSACRLVKTCLGSRSGCWYLRQSARPRCHRTCCASCATTATSMGWRVGNIKTPIFIVASLRAMHSRPYAVRSLQATADTLDSQGQRHTVGHVHRHTLRQSMATCRKECHVGEAVSGHGIPWGCGSMRVSPSGHWWAVQ